MGYTYNDFVSAANGAGLMDKFSPEDIETTRKNPEYGLSMLGFMKDAQNATTAEQRTLAEAAADQLRKTYQTVASSGSLPQFTYDNESQYKQLLDKVSNPEAFSYDAQQDDAYKAARAAYLREGERASTNALVRASTATGGVPSSYAVSAATQAGDYYAGQVADLIPTMEQNAYQRYLSGLDADRTALSVVEGDRATAYSRFLDQLSLERQQKQDALALQQWEYQQEQDALALKRQQEQDALALQQLEYQKQQDALALKRQQEQDALARQQQEQAQARQKYNEALALYQLLGYATPEIAATLGIPESTPQFVTPVGDTSSTDGTPYTGGGVDNGGYDQSDVAKVQNALIQMGAKITADGLWGDQSRAAAMDLLKVSSVAEAKAALDALGNQGDPGVEDVVLDTAIQNLRDEYRNSNGQVSDYEWLELLKIYDEKDLRAAGLRPRSQAIKEHGSYKPRVNERM